MNASDREGFDIDFLHICKALESGLKQQKAHGRKKKKKKRKNGGSTTTDSTTDACPTTFGCISIQGTKKCFYVLFSYFGFGGLLENEWS